VVPGNWEWDPLLYAGSARYYASGRLPYPAAVTAALRQELGLDGRGRCLDLGCGPGSLTLLLAGLFNDTVGLDADAAMIEEARRRARGLGVRNVQWIHMRAEGLPAGLGRFRVVTLAQSFHWMDRPRVATALAGLLDRDGALVHVAATTDRGVSCRGEPPGPSPPWDRIDELIAAYLGAVRRAGRGVRPAYIGSGDDEVFRASGFSGPRRCDIDGRVFQRTEDEVVASVYSLSSAAPHLFGDRLDAFDRDLRKALRQISPSGQFWERSGEVALSIWHPPS
jgi:SAM-dependent methyltransferase